MALFESTVRKSLRQLNLDKEIKASFEEIGKAAHYWYMPVHRTWDKLNSESVTDCDPALKVLLSEDPEAVCYDITKELNLVKCHLLTLCKFTLCQTKGFSQNICSFVVLLHDYPLKVEKTELYHFVKKWRSPDDL